MVYAKVGFLILFSFAACDQAVFFILAAKEFSTNQN
jgi:hypothetical protein